MKKSIWRDSLFVVLLVALDQITKYLAVRYLKGNEGISILPGIFRLQLLEGGNSGAAFGILQGKFWFFFVSTLLILGGILFLLIRMPKSRRLKPLYFTLLLLSSGAIGNFIDRVFTYFTEGYNYVIDFLYFEWIDFPIFNVADCYVTVSAGLLLLLFLFYYKEEGFEWFINKEEKS